MLGAQVESGWNDGKRYRLVDERDDAWSDNEAVPNAFFKLEMPRAWQASGSLGPPPNGEGEAAQFGFPHGNQIT